MARIYRKKDGSTSQSAQVLDFVCSNPCCTAHDIQLALGFDSHATSVHLTRLRKNGFIAGEKLAGSKLWCWMPVDAHDVDDGRDHAPIRRIVSKEWVCTTKRHPLDVFLFGEAA